MANILLLKVHALKFRDLVEEEETALCSHKKEKYVYFDLRCGAWNGLEENLKLAINVDQFKKMYKKYIFSRYTCQSVSV